MVLQINITQPRFWAWSDYSYAAWIPNVSGQLSFSIIGTGLRPTGVAAYNGVLENRKTRLIAAHKKRWSPDFPFFPEWSLPFVDPSAGIDFILLAESMQAKVPIWTHEKDSRREVVDEIENAQGALVGKVYIIPRDSGATETVTRSAVLSAKVALEYSQSDKAEEIKLGVESAITDGREKGSSIFEIEFALFRTGEFRCWHKRDFASGVEVDCHFESLRYDIVKQSFYFVKDLVHRHYHHDDDSDQFVGLTEIVNEPGKHADSEIAWRRQTLWDLARVVTQFRRGGRWSQLNKALGVIAYADAFQRGFAHSVRSSWGKKVFQHSKKIHLYDFGQMKESIKISLEDSQFKRTANWQLLTLLLATGLSLMAFWSSSISGLYEKCYRTYQGKYNLLQKCVISVPDDLSTIRIFVSDNFIYILICTIIVVCYLQHIFLRDRPPSEFIVIRKFRNFCSLLTDLVDAAIQTSVRRVLRIKGFHSTSWLLLAKIFGGFYGFVLPAFVITISFNLIF